MRKFLTPGLVTGALAAGAVVAGVAGKPMLAAYLSDPTTAADVLTAAGAIGSIIAGVMRGWSAPAA